MAGILGFIQLDDLSECERGGLQAHVPNLLLNGLPQLREGEIQEQEMEKKGEAYRGFSKAPKVWEDNTQMI